MGKNYYIGMTACGASGSKKGGSNLLLILICIFLNSFGGGILRDAILLQTEIWALTPNAIPDIEFVCLIGIVTGVLCALNIRTINRIFDNVIFWFDSIGLGSFISIGADKAFSFGCDTFTCIVSAYFTACYGGVLASICSGNFLFTTSILYYHFIVILGSTLYVYYPNGFIICLFTALCLLMEKINFMATFNYVWIIVTHICISTHIRQSIYSLNDRLYKFHDQLSIQHRFKKLLRMPKVFIAYHRIRVC